MAMRSTALRAIWPHILPSVRSQSSIAGSVDRNEVAKFGQMAARWWDPRGSAAPLHRMNPVRIAYIRAAIERRVQIDSLRAPSKAPLGGVKLVDVGCGGGLVTEPMARLGANVLGVDMSPEGIAVAKEHARQDIELASSDRLKYEQGAVEDLAASGAKFDVVLALEIVEHVAHPSAFVRDCASLVADGGLLIMSTLNRTAASYALGIIAAERILRWLPVGTHNWTRFPRPDELSSIIDSDTELTPDELVGVALDPRTGRFSIVKDVSVNYIMTAYKPRDQASPQEPTSGTV